MSKVLTNNITLAYTIESSLGVLPGSPQWFSLEPNEIGAYGPDITTTPRRPISPNRGRRKGTVTDKDSVVEFEEDLTMSSFENFAEGFVFAEFANKEFNLRSSSGTLPPPVASATTWTIDAASTLLAGKVQWVAAGVISLVYAAGYTNAVNNGLHALTADLAGASTVLSAGAGLVVETPPTSATLHVCGLRMDDATFTVSGSTATLVSAGDVNWTSVGLNVGQYIHLGSATSAGAVQNAMQSSAPNDTFGYARITAITATTLTLDKLDVNLGAGGSPYTPTTLDVMFGRFLRNVLTTADSDDNRYLERSFQFEVAYPDLGGIGTTEYEYAIGNWANEWTLNAPAQDKMTMGNSFVGANVDDITSTRKSGAGAPVAPNRTTAVNTSSDFASLSTDLLSSVGDVCFKEMTFTVANGVTPEKCLGTLGAVNLNTGLFEVNIEAQMQFTNKAIINAVSNNTTVTMAMIIKNEDGGIAFDIPAMTLSGGDKEFPVDATVLVNLEGQAFNDPNGTIPNVSLGISLFPTVPTVR